ncbi:AAA family ATPase [Desulfobacterales bacterium HSG16]|nr:AAA family ATPase [Desulfobacterales bacterium HSG16]
MIDSVSLTNFTAFKSLDLKCSKGINIFIGANSTGKSHLLKLMYALCSANKQVNAQIDENPARILADKLKGVFKPEGKIGRLCHNNAQKSIVQADFTGARAIEFAFSIDLDEILVINDLDYLAYDQIPVFITPKEMLSSFPGFSSLYLQREITIDETYFDLCQALEMPKLRDKPDKVTDHLIDCIKAACGGEFLLIKQQRFYYKPNKGIMLEAELSAEGFRKLGMLQRLLQNGRISPGKSGPLFWDEPEANLNPKLVKTIVTILIELSRSGHQIFLATHDYVLLKWFDLLMQPDDNITFHALYQNDEGRIELNSTDDYLKICPNAIDDAYAELVDQEIAHSMGDLGK